MNRGGSPPLVEITILVVIIAVLATDVTFKYKKLKEYADLDATRTVLAATAKQIVHYEIKHNRYPASIEAMIPDYLEAVPNDAWGNPIDVVAGPRVVSRGPDGAAGTPDDMAYP